MIDDAQTFESLQDLQQCNMQDLQTQSNSKIIKDQTISEVESLSSKMDALTSQIIDNCEISGQMIDLGDQLESKSYNVLDLNDPNVKLNLPELINLQEMMKDFTYIRSTLKESVESGKQITKIISGMILDQTFEVDTKLVSALATINSSIIEGMKLFMKTYKEVSDIIINIEKVRTKQLVPQNNTLNINNTTKNEIVKSTAELIKELQQVI